MLVCWEWLSQYVDLSPGSEDIDPDSLANRFAMTGLNHESTEVVGKDTVLDLEVTSNRSDCLGHIGVAREAAVILRRQLCLPKPAPNTSGPNVSEVLQVENQFPEGCSQYSARVIRGVKVGPSPEWLVRRLQAIGINSVNNVVDVTNYVMMECGQPLHAFDLAHIQGGKIVVRAAKNKEQLQAIDHRSYELDSQMVVIADAERAVAIGGVMGGADSEVGPQTTDLLIEAAAFEPKAIRRAARLLKLQSPSSFRFERRPDPAGLDWASLRCCQLILETAGGTLCPGVAHQGATPTAAAAITLRVKQVPRVLGIDIPNDEMEDILQRLGCQVAKPKSGDELHVIPPSWRADLSREVDLIEEVARIYGYERIPEDVSVPLSVAALRPKDVAMGRIRHTLSAYGIDEAMTPSVVSENFEKVGSVWTDQAALATETPLLVGARLLRRSLIPSLLAARYTNQAQSIREAELFEVASIYLPLGPAAEAALPRELCALGIVSRGDLQRMKGIVEEIIAQVAGRREPITWQAAEHALFAKGSLQSITLRGATVGYVGLVSPAARDSFSLDLPVAAAELNVDELTSVVQTVRRAERVSPFPASSRDLNFVVDEDTRWQKLSQTCRSAADQLLQSVDYRETYRDAKKDGAGKKRILLTLVFQSLERTLTSDEVDNQIANIIQACQQKLGAQLLS